MSSTGSELSAVENRDDYDRLGAGLYAGSPDPEAQVPALDERQLQTLSEIGVEWGMVCAEPALWKRALPVDPNLGSYEFLCAVMRDRRTPLAARVEAASKAADIEQRCPHLHQPVAVVRIEGGLPKEPVDKDLLAQHPMLRLVT